LFTAEDAASLYQFLEDNSIQGWVVGGWGIDALLREQTRPHKDFDINVLLDDVVHMRLLLEQRGYTLAYLWEENCLAVDGHGSETPTAFVLRDPEGREVDVHALRLDEQGNGMPAWVNDDRYYEKSDLAGEGIIGGVSVRCISARMQVSSHTGYELPESQVQDLAKLVERFGIGSPDPINSERRTA